MHYPNQISISNVYISWFKVVIIVFIQLFFFQLILVYIWPILLFSVYFVFLEEKIVFW